MKKLTLGMIVPAIALLGAAGTASAAIDNDSAANTGTGDGGGELYLSVVDRGGPIERSYVLDLGITSTEFLALDSPTYSLSFAADANLLDILNNAQGTIAWNIVGASNWYGPSGDNFDQLGVLTTSANALNPFNIPSGFAGIETAMTNLYIQTNSVNGTGPGSTDYAADISQIFPSTHNAFYDNGAFGSNIGQIQKETGLGESLAFYFVAWDYNFETGEDISRADLLSGVWTLSEAGLLTYAAAAAPVPLPAGVWLLGSALLGMAGIGRRRKAGVATA